MVDAELQELAGRPVDRVHRQVADGVAFHLWDLAEHDLRPSTDDRGVGLRDDARPATGDPIQDGVVLVVFRRYRLGDRGVVAAGDLRGDPGLLDHLAALDHPRVGLVARVRCVVAAGLAARAHRGGRRRRATVELGALLAADARENRETQQHASPDRDAAKGSRITRVMHSTDVVHGTLLSS